MRTKIPDKEYRKRIQNVRKRLAETPADAAVWFGATSIHYLTGFHHIQTERPVVLAVTDERVDVTVPRLEVGRVEDNPRIDGIYEYFDYPGGNPIEAAVAMLEAADVESVTADMDGSPGVWGYRGPSLSEFVKVSTQSWVTQMRFVKSPVEIDLLRESARWASLAHRYLMDNTEPGRHPATVSQRAELEASRVMLDTLGDQYVPYARGDGPVRAGFISGEQTALPHGHTANRRLEHGDGIITGATANVDGYRIELERTMFVGEPDDEQVHYFELMRKAQDVAFDAFQPEEPVSIVADAVWEYFEEQGVADLAQHHVGHNRGLERHEPPYVDRGSEETIEPGHVYTIEPGIYTQSAGYRHSDTVLVTENGAERLSHFPRDLDTNIIRFD